MALSSASVTMNLADMLGIDFDTRRTKIWVSTNVPGDTVIDGVGNAIRIGSGGGANVLAADGSATISVWIPGTGSNPATWQTSIHVDYPDPGTRSRKVRTFGPFTITTSADLADLVAEQEVPPEYLTTVTTLLDGYVTDAETARDEAEVDADRAEAAAADAVDISGISTSDGVVSALIDTVAGPLTQAALSASYAAVLTPEAYGAVGDGVTDDTTAVVAAFAAAAALRVVGIGGNIWHSGAVVQLRGTYSLASLASPILVSCDVDGRGATLVAPNGYDASVLLVGHEDDGDCLHGGTINLPHVTGTAPSALEPGSVGVTFQNLYTSDVNVGRVIFFETGLRFTGKGVMGTAYNRIFPGWVDFCQVAHLFDSGTGGTGWANSNSFYGGSIQQSPVYALVRREAGWRHVVMEGGTGNSVHGNNFFGTSFEGNLSAYYFDLHNASENHWHPGTRFEQGDTGRAVLMASDLLHVPHEDIYLNSHGVTVGDMVCFTATTYPSPMAAGVAYYVVATAVDHFSVATTSGGTAVVFTEVGADAKLLRPPTIVSDNTDENTYGNVIHDGYNSYPGPLELVQIDTPGPGPRTGLEF